MKRKVNNLNDQVCSLIDDKCIYESQGYGLLEENKIVENHLQGIVDKVWLLTIKNEKKYEDRDKFMTSILHANPQSFNNIMAQIFLLNPDVEFQTDGIDCCKNVHIRRIE